MANPKMVLYRIVGIDGSQTPDPRYWQSRWTAELADTDPEAVKQHLRHHASFYTPYERSRVKVLGTIAGEHLAYTDGFVWLFIRREGLF